MCEYANEVCLLTYLPRKVCVTPSRTCNRRSSHLWLRRLGYIHITDCLWHFDSATTTINFNCGQHRSFCSASYLVLVSFPSSVGGSLSYITIILYTSFTTIHTSAFHLASRLLNQYYADHPGTSYITYNRTLWPDNSPTSCDTDSYSEKRHHFEIANLNLDTLSCTCNCQVVATCY